MGGGWKPGREFGGGGIRGGGVEEVEYIADMIAAAPRDDGRECVSGRGGVPCMGGGWKLG